MSKPQILALCVGGIVAVLCAGLLFAACQSSVVPGTSSTGAITTAADVSLGETIYRYGTDASGRPIPRSGVTGMMGSAAACTNCHGSDARGQTIQMMMSQVEVPDIRWSTLTAPPSDPADKAFDPNSFFLAVTRGLDPNGSSLEPLMPRWELTRAESDASYQIPEDAVNDPDPRTPSVHGHRSSNAHASR